MSAKILRFLTFVCILSINSPGFAQQKPILDIKKWSTKAGTPVLFVHETELPMLDIQVVFDAGSARDASKPGLAKITNEALSSGTQTKSVDQIASAFDDVGARFSTAVSRDMAVVAMRSLSDPKFLQPAFNAFSDVLTHPNFPNNEFLRIQKQTLNILDEQEEQPTSIALKEFYRTIYDDNPYGHSISGNKASVSKLTVDDLRQFYKSLYTAQNALIAIVGNVNEDKARQLAENISMQLNKGEELPRLSFVSLDSRAQRKHIAFPSSQTHVLIGQTGISRNDPAYFPIIVGNYILGGGMLTSRLFEEVRGKRGLAYSVRSQFNAMKHRGPFMVELQTRNSEAGNAIKVVNDTLSNFVKVGPSEQELGSAQKNLTQGFILRLAGNSAIMSQLISIGYYQLPLNYLDTYQSKILNVTDQQIKAAFQNIIHPDRLVTVTVGNNVVAQDPGKPLS